MTARKVVTRSGRKIRGVFPSRKVGKLIEWESLLERDTILLLEFSPGVKRYRQQPERIDYADGDTLRRYYPDFEVITTNDEILHLEAKPSSELAKPDVQRKLRLVPVHERDCHFLSADEGADCPLVSMDGDHRCARTISHSAPWRRA